MNDISVPLKDTGKPGAGTTMLLVDDEESVLKVVSRLMEREGFKVLTARDGRSAIDVFRASMNDIHVAVVDMTMPGMDGETVCRELLRIKPGIALIFASGFGSGEVAARFAPGEIAGCIQKPYRHGVLIEMVLKALA